MLIRGSQLRTRSALLGKLCAAHCVTTAAGKSRHIVKGPDQRHPFWQPRKKRLQIQKIRNPMQVDYVTLGNLPARIQVKWRPVLTKKSLILGSASLISLH